MKSTIHIELKTKKWTSICRDESKSDALSYVNDSIKAVSKEGFVTFAEHGGAFAFVALDSIACILVTEQQ